MSASQIHPNAIFMIDSDIDHSKSVIAELFSSKTDAFSRPSIICNYIDSIPEDETIKIVINTSGGALCHLEKILKKLLKHKAGYIVYIKNECYSAGAMLALGAKEIVMNNDSYLGKIDPQKGSLLGSAQSIIYTTLEEEYIDSKNIYEVQSARYVLNYTHRLLDMIPFAADSKQLVLKNLLDSELPHEALFSASECKEMNLPIREPKLEEQCYFSDLQVTNYKAGKRSYSTRYIGYMALVVISCYLLKIML